MIIAMDGPGGTGKGTICKLIAERLDYVYIDTGAMYRAFTLKLIRQKISIDDVEAVKMLLENTIIDFDNNQNILLDGENVSSEIRQPNVSELVPKVSSIVFVREKMVLMQRELGKTRDIIMEGRDITTVVFPNADLKIYLTADLDERARRRYKEYVEKGIKITYEKVLESIKERDYIDMHKEVGALKVAEDAVVIDSTNLSIEEVYDEVIKLINKEEKNEPIR